MKKNIIPVILLGCLCAGSVNAQKTISTISKLQTTPLSWFSTAKLSFYNAQKNSTGSSVVASRTVSAGTLQLGVGPAFDGDLLETNKSSTSTTLSGGKVVCKSVAKELDLKVKPEFNILKAVSHTQIFPGVISTASAILSESVVTPANLPARKPISVSMVLPGANVSSIVLDNPGTLQLDKVNTIIRNNVNIPIPAMAGIELNEVDSKFDFAAQLEASSGLFFPLEEFDIPAEVNAGGQFSGNIDGSTKRKTYLLKFIQPMFILSYPEFNSANIFQDPNAAASKGDLVFINSVTYGRMVFIKIVSEESAINIKSAVKAKLGVELTELNVKAGHSIEGSGSTSFSSVVKEFKAFVLGGNISGVTISDPEALKAYIDDPTAKTLSLNSRAVPISFTMVRLSDFLPLGIRSVANFQAIQDCQAINGYSVFVNKLSVSKVVDNPLTGNNEDLYGTISVQAFYKKADGTEMEIKDESNRGVNVWNESSSSPVQLKEGEGKVLFKTDGSIQDGKRRFIITPEQEATGYIIIKYRIKDKIMQDGEQLGNSNSFVKYDEKDYKFFLKDWVDVKDGAGCTHELKEVGGDAKVCIDLAMRRE
jgi:hypothetical protein